jgi:Na+-transporting NADH:ubiquinone oxidoreductase subunit NqrB
MNVAVAPMGDLARVLSQFCRDARYGQIACLGTLLLLLVLRADPGVERWQGLICVGVCLIVQWLCCRLVGVRFDGRSPMITGLSLGLLFRADIPALWAAAALLAVGSKFVLRVGGKHIFNPANFAISVLLLLLPDDVWVSPGQWGAALWLAFGLAAAGGLVVQRAARGDIALAFLLAYGAMLVTRCEVLGDPLTIPAHQLQSGALLLFGCFMITDPRATPDHRAGRMVFAIAVAALAYHLQFVAQIRPGLFLALFFVSPVVPLIDLVLPAARFTWTRSKEA